MTERCGTVVTRGVHIREVSDSIPVADQSELFIYFGFSYNHRYECRIGISFPISINISVRSFNQCKVDVKHGKKKYTSSQLTKSKPKKQVFNF